MDPRKEQLLELVIEQYIRTAEPIGSRFLVGAGDLNIGEATIRNELRLLEDEGYLTHPHTSAGRIPTEKGYRHYVNNLDVRATTLTKRDVEFLTEALQASSDYEQSRKSAAKALVSLADEAVIIAFSTNKVYYTGLTNLFSKPEFSEIGLVTNVSRVFDHCEDCLEDLYDQVDVYPRFFIGREHSFGSALTVLSARFGHEGENLVALLGPQRMDYQRNLSLVKKMIEIL